MIVGIGLEQTADAHCRQFGGVYRLFTPAPRVCTPVTHCLYRLCEGLYRFSHVMWSTYLPVLGSLVVNTPCFVYLSEPVDMDWQLGPLTYLVITVL